MPISINHYSKIKDKFCISYFGHCREYIVLLKYLRPIIEQQFPGLIIYLSCRDEVACLLNEETNIILRSKIKDIKYDIAYIKELRGDTKSHPIEQLIEESNVLIGKIKLKYIIYDSVVIYSKGSLPTLSLSDQEVNLLISEFSKKGLKTSVNVPASGECLVVGVENESFISAALDGRPTEIIERGIGTNLYLKLFEGKIRPYF